MPLPETGVVALQGHSSNNALGAKAKRAIIINLSDETLEALLRQRSENPANPPMDIEFGDHPGIHIGNKFFSSRVLKESSPHELFIRYDKLQAPLRHYALVEGKLTVSRELGAKLEHKIKSSREESDRIAKDRKIQLLDRPPLPSKKGMAKVTKKKTGTSSLMKQVAKNEGHRRSINSIDAPSRLSSPLPPPHTTKNAHNSHDLTRKRLVHFLALAPATTLSVIQVVGGPDCDAASISILSELLKQVAIEDPPPKKSNPQPPPRLWRLKSESWLEVRPYEYPNLEEAERKNMARQARSVLVGLKIPQGDARWQYVEYRRVGADGNHVESQREPEQKKGGVRTREEKGKSNVEQSQIKAKKIPAEIDTKSSNATATPPRRSLPGSKNRLSQTKNSPPLPSPPVSGSAIKVSTTVQDQRTPTTKITPKPKSTNPSPRVSLSDLTQGHSLPVSNEDKGHAGELAVHGTSINKRKRPLSEEEIRAADLKRIRSTRDSEELREMSNGLKQKSALGDANNSDERSRGQVSLKTSRKHNTATPGERAISRPAESANMKGPKVSGSRIESQKPVKTTPSSSRRRKSPIYTSSDDDASPVPEKRPSQKPISDRTAHRRNVAYSPYISPKIPIGGPLPKERSQLRGRYQSMYPIYLSLYQKCVEQRVAIERILGNSTATEEGEVDDDEIEVDADVEMLEASDLEKLRGDCERWRRELTRINDALERPSLLEPPTSDSR